MPMRRYLAGGEVADKALSFVEFEREGEFVNQPLVGVIMGSQSDWSTMSHTCQVLEELGVAFEKKVVSAHRTPDYMFEYASTAKSRGLKVMIAGAGGAAHLPGMVAAKTELPVVGVPVQTSTLQGMESLLSIVQMPGGVPVATMAIGRAGAINAALYAARILALMDDGLADRLLARTVRVRDDVLSGGEPGADE